MWKIYKDVTKHMIIAYENNNYNLIYFNIN